MTETSPPVRLAILGAGARGSETYAQWLLRHPHHGRVVAVADPVRARRDQLADRAGLAPDDRFDDWRPLLAAADRLHLDAVVVALPDRDHVAPTLAAAELGLVVLLEKPAAVTPNDLETLADGARRLNARIGVGHVLRFTPFWQTVHAVVSSGAIGGLVTVLIEENIGFWHFAHSYVRGNWRRADMSSPMVLAKTCHDLDLIRWFAGSPPTTVASVGTLSYFTAQNAPPGAPARCLDGCPHAESCPFFAPRFYLDRLADVSGWPVSALGPDTTPGGRLESLRVGPYGRCVFHSDNDVADHQQTVFEFPGGLTATLSASAFTGENTRTVRLTGTAGEITGHMDSGRITVELFSPPAQLPELLHASLVGESARPPLGHRVIVLSAVAPQAAVSRGDAGGYVLGHAGGDDALIDAFIRSIRAPRSDRAFSASLEESLDSHRMAFAAERSRLEGRVIPWDETVQA